ncbi:MAG: PAS domain-containing sensor histidine kinase [Candidatus Sericytochromatia bacterium]|nr:PAS domain-containing sensor histidine kinase [Candidatus Sericytochromatia bacterium]
MDATGRIECVNRKAETLFGLSAGTTGDVTLGSLLIQPADAPADVLQHLLRTSFEVPSPWEGRRTDGSHFPCDVTIYTLPGDDGATHAIHVRDMSEHREVDRLRREFLSTVSHRLRTPLSAIRGSLGLLAKGVVGQLPAPAHEMLVIAERNSVRMASLINDILDLEFLESGQMVLRWTNQSLNDALNLLPAALKASLTARRITLDVFGGEIRLAADADRLAQLLEKLLTNAANFSPAGSTVAIAVAAADGWVNVEVHDRGPGIAPAHRQIVFERFWQADTLDSSQRGGAGLGLTIARAIVALHGGTIGVGSNVTEGTTLWFRLPANAKLDTGPLSLA